MADSYPGDALIAMTAERDRAVETRENANAVTLRVEAERDGYRKALEEIHTAAVRHDYDRISGIASKALNLYGKHLRDATGERCRQCGAAIGSCGTAGDPCPWQADPTKATSALPPEIAGLLALADKCRTEPPS